LSVVEVTVALAGLNRIGHADQGVSRDQEVIRVLEQLTVGQVLERWRDELVRAGITTTADVVAGDTERVTAVERRLGVALPPSYREFLALCGGMPVTGALTAGLRPAERVGWFRDLEADWVQAWRETAVDPDDPGPEVALMNRALLVSEPGDQALLLDPDDIDPATGEWACYTLSNFAAGSHRVGGTFRAGLEYLYRSFLAAHPVPSATLDEVEQTVEEAYQAMLAGDLAQRDRLEYVLSTSWRAWLLAAQFDAFGARPYESRDQSISVQVLWWGTVGGVSAARALADPVLVDELVPLWVIRLIEAAGSIDWELHRAPRPVAQRMRSLLAQIADGTGPIADFAYSPAFASHMDIAREQIAAGEQDAAWDTVRYALPTWTPMSRNHLAPLGLYYDKDLRRLLTPPPPAPQAAGRPPAGIYTVALSTSIPAPSAHPTTTKVTPLAQRKQYSDRTLSVLTTPYHAPE
jgi:SMI1/KNR4 family protein SUKH-1